MIDASKLPVGQDQFEGGIVTANDETVLGGTEQSQDVLIAAVANATYPCRQLVVKDGRYQVIDHEK